MNEDNALASKTGGIDCVLHQICFDQTYRALPTELFQMMTLLPPPIEVDNPERQTPVALV